MVAKPRISCIQVLVTSEAGAKQQPVQACQFKPHTDLSEPTNSITIYPDNKKQKMTGVGTSFTQSSAFVLAHLSVKERDEVMQKIYGEEGANFSLARTHIGACDFCVEGKYSYADVPDDKQLEHFSITPDTKSFDAVKYPNLNDPTFSLMAMIQQAKDIKQSQEDDSLKIIASAWTAPPWMKTINDWYQTSNEKNGYQGTGGQLKAEYEHTYAQYLVRYLQTYAEHGVDIWGLTPVNEPHGNNGQWESMHFTPESQNSFIKNHLGPVLQNSQFAETKLLIYDQNRDGIEDWTDVILADPESASFVYGTAIHWYESTFKVYEEVLDRVHAKFPTFDIIHTEGCIDDLGKPAPEGILDPEGFQESDWFNNDAFWWNDNATDWAYTASWAPKVEDHPKYTPVHRYARNIIVSFNHWMSGWIDWNIVLDQQGGPNHVGNFCGAPIMIDTHTREIYYTPVYHVLSQLSRTIRPGDYALTLDLNIPELVHDTLHACATINADKIISVQLLNTSKEVISLTMIIEGYRSELNIPANCLQTLQLQHLG